MNKIKDLTMDLANNLRKKGLNFAIIIESEDGEIHSQYSIKESSSIGEMCKSLNDILLSNNKGLSNRQNEVGNG